MTKKHFEMLAEALKNTEASYATIEAVARVCKAANLGFKEEKFKEAATCAKLQRKFSGVKE